MRLKKSPLHELVRADPHSHWSFILAAMPKFVPRIRKHKKLQNRDRNQSDTNAAVVLPASEAEREEKRQKLREELRAQQPKISSKKQKRLNKYIVRTETFCSLP